jgi:hypothetical protein
VTINIIIYFLNLIFLFLFEHYVLKIGSCFRSQVKAYSVGPDSDIGKSAINLAQMSRLLLEDGDRVRSPKCCIKITRQEDG